MQATGLSVRLGNETVLQEVNFSLPRGEFVALLGANGSGKTTLLRALMGLVPAVAGELSLLGTALGRFQDWASVGYVPQRLSAAPGVPATAEEVVLSGRIPMSRWFRGFSKQDRTSAKDALEIVGLADVSEKMVSILSGGQQQRVLIARALVNRPTLLMLDEPISSVDVENQSSFFETLSSLDKPSTSVILVAHSLGMMRPLVDRTVILDRGRIIYDGPPNERSNGDRDHHHSADQTSWAGA